jgi:hypothetical protein
MPLDPHDGSSCFLYIRVDHFIGGGSPKLHVSDVTSTSMGAGGEDVLLSKAARDVFPYSVECKSLAKVSVYKHIDQAVSNCPDGAEPLVVMKADRRNPIVIIDAAHFLSIIRRLKK